MTWPDAVVVVAFLMSVVLMTYIAIFPFEWKPTTQGSKCAMSVDPEVVMKMTKKIMNDPEEVELPKDSHTIYVAYPKVADPKWIFLWARSRGKETYAEAMASNEHGHPIHKVTIEVVEAEGE